MTKLYVKQQNLNPSHAPCVSTASAPHLILTMGTMQCAECIFAQYLYNPY